MSQHPAMSEKYFRRQASLWLIAAVVVTVLWLLIWLTTSAPKMMASANEESSDEQTSTALPSHIESFADLEKEVKPIDFSALIRDMRTYPAEFKDKIYFENMGKQYTIQLLDIVENQVIVDYLDNREERKNFAYFRYLDKEKNPRYILTYGKFKTEEEAQEALKTANFNLPTTIQPKIVQASYYLTIIENYMRADAIVDSASRQRSIRLQATRTEIPVKAATEADENLARRSQEQQAQEQQGLSEVAPTADTPTVKEEIKKTIVEAEAPSEEKEPAKAEPKESKSSDEPSAHHSADSHE